MSSPLLTSQDESKTPEVPQAPSQALVASVVAQVRKQISDGYIQPNSAHIVVAAMRAVVARDNECSGYTLEHLVKRCVQHLVASDHALVRNFESVWWALSQAARLDKQSFAQLPLKAQQDKPVDAIFQSMQAVQQRRAKDTRVWSRALKIQAMRDELQEFMSLSPPLSSQASTEGKDGTEIADATGTTDAMDADVEALLEGEFHEVLVELLHDTSGPSKDLVDHLPSLTARVASKATSSCLVALLRACLRKKN